MSNNSLEKEIELKLCLSDSINLISYLLTKVDLTDVASDPELMHLLKNYSNTLDIITKNKIN